MNYFLILMKMNHDFIITLELRKFCLGERDCFQLLDIPRFTYPCLCNSCNNTAYPEC